MICLVSSSLNGKINSSDFVSGNRKLYNGCSMSMWIQSDGTYVVIERIYLFFGDGANVKCQS